jgi:hypothetical protein
MAAYFVLKASRKVLDWSHVAEGRRKDPAFGCELLPEHDLRFVYPALVVLKTYT